MPLCGPVNSGETAEIYTEWGRRTTRIDIDAGVRCWCGDREEDHNRVIVHDPNPRYSQHVKETRRSRRWPCWMPGRNLIRKDGLVGRNLRGSSWYFTLFSPRRVRHFHIKVQR